MNPIKSCRFVVGNFNFSFVPKILKKGRQTNEVRKAVFLEDGYSIAQMFHLSSGSQYELKAVNIDGCDSRIPCHVTVGEDVPVSLDFYADSVSRNLDQNVVIHINHLNLRTRVSPERCEIYDCAVTTGMVTSFTSLMSVPTTIALNQRGYLFWRIENEEGKQVLCYSVMVQTQSPLQKLMRKFLNTINATVEKQS